MANDAQRPPAGALAGSLAGSLHTGVWKTYLELAAGLGETSRKRVRKVVKDMVGKGNATADQLKAITTEVLEARAANREAVGKLVKLEVDRALGRVGLATVGEVNELTARVHDLERQLREAHAAQAAPQPTVEAAPVARGRAAKATAATVAAISPVVKQATRRAASAKATIAKATGTVAAKATAARRTGTTPARAASKATAAVKAAKAVPAAKKATRKGQE